MAEGGMDDFSGAISLPFSSEKVFKFIRHGLPGSVLSFPAGKGFFIRKERQRRKTFFSIGIAEGG